MPFRGSRQPAGFSLLELVVVIVIIAILAAVALPKMSRGSSGANNSALAQDLAVLRKGIELYAADHQGKYPTAANFKRQLTKSTDESGNVGTRGGPQYIYGPYLASISSLPFGNGGSQVGTTTSSSNGWVYDPDTGGITANTGTLTDDSGVPYSNY